MKLVDEKFCKGCSETKPASAFVRNRTRNDGLKDLCKVCEKTYVPSRTRSNLDIVVKRCSRCERELSSRMFVYTQNSDDKLMPHCRTCKQWKGKGHLSASDADAFEAAMDEIFRSAASMVGDPRRNRSLFENFIAKEFKRKFGPQWALPIWINGNIVME